MYLSAHWVKRKIFAPVTGSKRVMLHSSYVHITAEQHDVSIDLRIYVHEMLYMHREMNL